MLPELPLSYLHQQRCLTFTTSNRNCLNFRQMSHQLTAQKTSPTVTQSPYTSQHLFSSETSFFSWDISLMKRFPITKSTCFSCPIALIMSRHLSSGSALQRVHFNCPRSAPKRKSQSHHETSEKSQHFDSPSIAAALERSSPPMSDGPFSILPPPSYREGD